MVKNKKARRPAKQLKFIRLKWLRRHCMYMSLNQRLLSIKHIHNINEQAKVQQMERAKLDVTAFNKKLIRLVRQIRKCKLK